MSLRPAEAPIAQRRPHTSFAASGLELGVASRCKWRLVRTFVEWAFEKVGIPIEWRGSGLSENGVNASTGEVVVEVDPRYFRPTEVDVSIGDASKAHQRLGWRYETSVRDLAREMVLEDLKLMQTATIIKEA